MKKADFITTISDLQNYLTKKKWDLSRISFPDEQEIRKQNFSILIPKYFIDIIDWHDPQDPLRAMVLTDERENKRQSYELTDPIGDKAHTPVPGIIHRYPDRALLNLITSCAVHCRFCFRRDLLEKSPANLQKSLEYLRNHTEISEVILSGGDPLTMTDAFLSHVLSELKKITHIKRIRFHTRTPAVYPQRVNTKFIQIIKKAAPASIIIHINHPREITKKFQDCIQKLHKSGAMLLSQTVLMKGVNNDAKILEQLFRGLVEINVKPYHLHHLDYAKGTSHFRISVEEGRQIMQKLQGSVSGICIPEYVIDTPGGHGKIPVSWFRETSQKGIYEAENFRGEKIQYIDPAFSASEEQF
jgi:lysine 2,3-aminomutase